METSAKKIKYSTDSIDVSGYIHDVSPQKIAASGNKYFNLVIQEEEEYTNAVSFDVSVHQQMIEMSKSKTPVTLKNVKKTPSLKSSGKFDIRFNQTSSITASRKLTFENQMPQTSTYLTLSEVQNLNAYQKTSIKVKVFDKGDIESQTLRSGSQMNKCQVAVADQTATMPLTVWHKEIENIVIGESYNISNVSVRVFGRKSITTCPDTVISKVSDIGHWLYQPTGNTSVEKEIELDSVSCMSVHSCIACHKNVGQFNKEAPFVKCASCGMKMKTSKISTAFKCMIVSGKDRYTISDTTIKNCKELSHINDADELENFLLGKSVIKVSVCEFVITKILKFQ